MKTATVLAVLTAAAMLPVTLWAIAWPTAQPTTTTIIIYIPATQFQTPVVWAI